MTLVPIAFRRRLPSQPDPALPVLIQPGLPVPGAGRIPGAPTVAVPTVAALPESSGLASATPSSSKIPPRWAVALVALVLILVSALIGLGHPVSYVLEALAGAGWLGVELVRLLNREL